MSDTSKFSSKEAFRFGWATFKNNKAFLLPLFAGVAVIYIGLGAMQSFADEQSTGLSFVVSILDWLLRVSISIGLIEIPLMLMDGQKPDFGHLFSGFRHFVAYIVASLFYMLIVVGGFILLIVPGIIWALRFQFYGYLIIDKGMKPMQALRTSWAMTRGTTWDLFAFALIAGLINIAGALALMIGLLITVPVTLIALAFIYRKLVNQPQTAPVQAAA